MPDAYIEFDITVKSGQGSWVERPLWVWSVRQWVLRLGLGPEKTIYLAKNRDSPEPRPRTAWEGPVNGWVLVTNHLVYGWRVLGWWHLAGLVVEPFVGWLGDGWWVLAWLPVGMAGLAVARVLRAGPATQLGLGRWLLAGCMYGWLAYLRRLDLTGRFQPPVA